VLAGHAIALASTEDLSLLERSLDAIMPMASVSQSGSKLVDSCRAFYELARFAIARQRSERAVASRSHEQTEGPIITTEPHFGNLPSSHALEIPDLAAENHIVAPMDWDNFMDELQLEVGVSEMASFLEPFLPFEGRWQNNN